MTDRGTRQHHERRVYARRQRRTPGYVAKHAGKTPGRYCSDPDCCGNPRRRGEVTRQERLAPAPVDTRGYDDVDPAELRALSCTDSWCCVDCPLAHDLPLDCDIEDPTHDVGEWSDAS